MSAHAKGASLQPAVRVEWRLYSKIALFVSLVGVLGLLQLWMQWGTASLAYISAVPLTAPPVLQPPTLSPPPMPRLSELVADGSVFFYSLALYFASLYGVLTFRDHAVIKPLMIASLFTGLLLVSTVFFLAGIETFEYYRNVPHAYPFPADFFALAQAVCAVASLFYAMVCTFKLEGASAVAPLAPAQPIEQQS